MSRAQMLQTLVKIGGAATWPWPDVRLSREADAAPLDATKTLAAFASALAEMSGAHQAWVEHYIHTHQVRVAHDLGHIKRFSTPGEVVLDVGAAPFLLSIGLAASGYQVQSLDLNPERLQQIVSTYSLSVHRCDVEQERWPVEDGTMHTVAFFEVFEHLRIDLNQTMAELKRVLSPAGRALISTPNLRSLAGLFNLIHKGRSYSCLGDIHAEWEKLRTLGHMGHVREYTAWDLVPYFQKLGLEVEEIIYRGRFGVPDMDEIVDDSPHLSPFLTFVLRHPQT
jgi:SAM-dependent methyltransferase